MVKMHDEDDDNQVLTIGWRDKLEDGYATRMQQNPLRQMPNPIDKGRMVFLEVYRSMMSSLHSAVTERRQPQ